VQLTKEGWSREMARTLSRTDSNFTSDLGGNTSMEMVMGCDFSVSIIFIERILLYVEAADMVLSLLRFIAV
jgi:hypothetical protein